MRLRVKIPKTIKVGGLDYKIKWVIPTDKESGEEVWGWWRNHPRIIEIHPEADDCQVSSTFIHELLHAIDDCLMGNKLAEQDIKNITAGLHQVLEQLGVRLVR